MRKFLVPLLFVLSPAAVAHPVIYTEGIVASSFNMASVSDNQLMYTFRPSWAAGVNHWRFGRDGRNTELALAKLNYLAYRYNGDRSQANVYLHGGVGVVDAELGRRDTREAYMVGLDVDWETRTLYAAAKHYSFHAPALADHSMSQLRLGFAPYEASFEGLQTWFMLQAMHVHEVEDRVMLTPMLRFFHRNVLWEAGAGTRGEWMLNLMVHY